MLSKRLSSELNRFRWIAALMVLVAHLRNMLFVEYGDVVMKTIPVKLLYFFTGFGHEAVVVFFVISGLLVGGTSIDKYMQGRFDSVDFAIHRFSRIYIVLIPALIACSLLDHAGLAYFNDAQLYTHPIQSNYHRIFADHMDWLTALGNLFMLQHIAIDVFGSNAPLWSLSYEWCYYSLFLLAVGGILASRRLALRLLSGAAILLLLYCLPAEPVVWFSTWLLGAAIGFSPLRRMRINLPLAYAVFFSILTWSRFDHTYTTSQGMYINFRRDFAVAVGCFVLFTALAQRRSPETETGKFHRLMAKFSYSVYLLHLPFIVFLVAVLQQVFNVPFYQQPTFAGSVSFVVLLVMAYWYSYGFSLLTERHTDRLRARLNKAYMSWRGQPASGDMEIPQQPAASKTRPFTRNQR